MLHTPCNIVAEEKIREIQSSCQAAVLSTKYLRDHQITKEKLKLLPAYDCELFD